MRLRIAFLAPPNSICMINWAEKMQERGHDVLFLTEGAEQVATNVPTHQLKLNWSFSYLKFAFNSKLIERVLQGWGAHLVHAFYSTNYGLLAARQKICPPVLTVAGSDLLLEPKQNKLFYFVNRFVVEKMVWVNPVSQPLLNELADQYGAGSKSHLFPAGVDIKVFHPIRRPEGGPIRIISTRNFQPVYNHQLLVKVIPMVLKRRRDVVFQFLGKGPLLPEIEAKTKHFPEVQFFGWQPKEQVAKFLQGAQIYVSTSISDGTSASLLEAMACGLFPIVTDLPSNRDWIQDGRNGFLIPTEAPELLAEKILNALNDSGLRYHAQELNRKLVREKADMNEIVDRLEKLYVQLVEEKDAN